MENTGDKSPQIKNGIKLFQYLEELSLLNLIIRKDIRNLSEDEDFFDIEDSGFLPRLDKVFLRNWNPTSTDVDLLMSIERYEIEKMPKLPKQLEDWVDTSVQSFKMPELKKSIPSTERFDDSEERTKFRDKVPDLAEVPLVLKGWITKKNRWGKSKYEIIEERETKLFLEDFPELKNLYEQWIENKWTAWKEKNYQYLLVNTAYDKFYALRSFLKTEIDNFDLLWSHDIFSWKKDGEEIFHPVLFTPVILDFDPERNIITLKRDVSKKLIFDLSPIREALDEDNTNLADIDKLSEEINSSLDFDIWNSDLVHRYLGRLTRFVSPYGTSKYNMRDQPLEEASSPTAYNRHGIYLLKKTGKSWAEYSKKIQQDIESHDLLTPFLNDLVGIEGEKTLDEDRLADNGLQPLESTELFFPLPYNEEQKMIAKQIQSSYGSVVQGPPGTGKTHTIANLISRFLAQGKTVLVTSQKGQALSVLKNKIPKEIRNLAVSQVEEGAKDGDLQLAVREINTNLSDTTSFTPEKKAKKEQELARKREQIAEKNNEFQKKSLLDSREEIIIGIERISPIPAAQFVSTFDNSDEFKLLDSFEYSQQEAFTQSDIDSYIATLQKMHPETWDYAEFENIPDIESLPTIEKINRFFELKKELQQSDLNLIDTYIPSESEIAALDAIDEHSSQYLIHLDKASLFKQTVEEEINIVTENTLNDIVASFTKERVDELLASLNKAKTQLLSFEEAWQKEIFENAKNESEYERWAYIVDSLMKKISEYRVFDRLLLGKVVSVDQVYLNNLPSSLSTVNELSVQARKNNGRVKKGLSLLFYPESKKLLELTKIDGAEISTIEDLDAIHAYLSKVKLQIELRNLWSQSFTESKNVKLIDDNFRIVDLEALSEKIKEIIEFRREKEQLTKILTSLSFISSFDISSIDSLNKATFIFESLHSYLLVKEYANIFTEIADAFTLENAHDLVLTLQKNIHERNFESIPSVKQSLKHLYSRRQLCLEYFALKNEVFNDAIKLLQSKDSNQKHVAAFLVDLNIADDIKAITDFYKKIPELTQQQRQSIELHALEKKMKGSIPKTIDLIRSMVKNGNPVNIDLAKNIKWKKLISWLDYLHQGDSVSAISRDLNILRNQEKDLIMDLIEIEAWMHLKNRVSKEQKEALSSFAQSMKMYGSGSGKYASTHMRNARNALEVGKTAVPVWIMPMNMIHQLFPNPKAGMFDVVIFDEASQVDTRGLNIAYLGKKLLVVGDDEQVSPTSFTVQSTVTDLIARHISDIPNSVHFSTTSSLFDIAKIKMSEVVTLTEHFRCIEELISFSNKLSYNNNLKVLRDQLPKDRLEPVLEAVFVENGYEETNGQVNKPEAERIVQRLKEMLVDDKYRETSEDGKTRPTTFGIISLLGKDQTKCIYKMITEQISAKELEDHKIICGDPYVFQGDERDVILLSMVKACDQTKPETTIFPYTVSKKEYKQRINVALSRARNKMILFHSIPKSLLQNPDDLRKMILDWFYNHKTDQKKHGLQRIREEVERGRASEFEYSVGEIIIKKGYKVIPQYEVAGYRIDLVVQGENSKLAIECDGDKYHNAIEKWQDDIDREQILERSGWKFWRVAGSSFYRHKERALESLWHKLDDLGIKPSIE